MPYILISLFFVFFIGCFGGDEKIDENVIAPRKGTLLVSNLNLLDGGNIRIIQKNKAWNFEGIDDGMAVYINFFATWCAPCKAEIPHLNKLRAKHKDKLEIIGVLFEKGISAEDAKEFAKEYKMDYPVSVGENNFVLAENLGGVKGVPTSFMFNTKGFVIEDYKGAVLEEMIENDLQRALN